MKWSETMVGNPPSLKTAGAIAILGARLSKKDVLFYTM